MTDTINKTKLQLRTGLSFNGNDKTPPPSTKLLINHGKPNFTIPRAHKSEGGVSSGLTVAGTNATAASNNNFYAYKSANSSLRPSNMRHFQGDAYLINGRGSGSGTLESSIANGAAASDNEAAKVVLRRSKAAQPSAKEAAGGEDKVPEFILRQREIQERLAKENVLDFEKRRSGYFTQVLISPSTPNRTSFMETMASPAAVLSLEMLPSGRQNQRDRHEEEHPELVPSAEQDGVVEVEAGKLVQPESEAELQAAAEPEPKPKPEPETELDIKSVPETKRQSESELPVESHAELVPTSITSEAEVAQVTVNGERAVATNTTTEDEEEVNKAIEEVNKAVAGEEWNDEADIVPPELEPAVCEQSQENLQNGDAVPTENGDAHQEKVTISHTNGGPSIPAPDPSGALGANYEPKTVVSFSKDLGSEPNRYPDTVKVTKDAETSSELPELSKLKFDIKADDQDVQVTPVLRTE